MANYASRLDELLDSGELDAIGGKLNDLFGGVDSWDYDDGKYAGDLNVSTRPVYIKSGVPRNHIIGLQSTGVVPTSEPNSNEHVGVAVFVTDDSLVIRYEDEEEEPSDIRDIEVRSTSGFWHDVYLLLKEVNNKVEIKGTD